MNFDCTISIGDIISFISLIVSLISLFLISPIYSYFRNLRIDNSQSVVVNGGKTYINQNIVQQFQVSNINLNTNGNHDE